MPAFAAVILCCNEQECLPRCLESIADVAELYISVDENSVDQTEAIARQYTPHVFRHNLAETNSWAAVRNALQDEAEKLSSQEWFLWIDPDEWLAEGKQGMASLFTQAEQMGRTGLMVQMVDMPAGAEPGIRGASWQNCKFFRRGQRFQRRRHEHLPAEEPRAVCPQVAIHHQKLQRPEVQANCLSIKSNMDALLADWQDWQDMRAAYYIGDVFLNQQEDAATAVLWFERGLTLPDTIAGARSQLYAGLCAAQRKLGRHDEARRAAHCRWACDYRDGRDCAWQLGGLAADEELLDEAEVWFKTVLAMPETEPGLNQVLAVSPQELSYYGLAVVAGKRGNVTDANKYLRMAEKFGARPEYAILRQQIIAVVS